MGKTFAATAAAPISRDNSATAGRVASNCNRRVRCVASRETPAVATTFWMNCGVK